MRLSFAFTLLAAISALALVGATPAPVSGGANVQPEQGFQGGACRAGPGCGYGRKRAEALAAGALVLERSTQGKIQPAQGFQGGFCRAGPGCGAGRKRAEAVAADTVVLERSTKPKNIQPEQGFHGGMCRGGPGCGYAK
ncbi:unnamed protein product [Tilletia controversa]|uniref:Uncharacterized protein n=3 Tax=Tilletia TaxID=13289 RepID=A0A8X7T075_9BASI|nr:hypothetical protein CF336_g1112 [Tilletia laevis]KAE8204514.1 hypothetical protein CF328_g1039 [Tilletia controversa]KAE8264805.1 hypothetical protein A4X03_0g699 [Tilletia caries]KAE8208141.1 hypothetical protein CF335_g633 [Tilletia laevis]KAE8253561.1 hypothetical protein A4X06_0g1369 [Tilletia controversa]